MRAATKSEPLRLKTTIERTERAENTTAAQPRRQKSHYYQQKLMSQEMWAADVARVST
jgi:hypothetical protein